MFRPAARSMTYAALLTTLLLLLACGDGTVPVSSASAGGEATLFCDGHQGIVTDPNVVRTLVRILRE